MFASLNFIYVFLPLCLLFYYLFKKNNAVLLIFSLIFYGMEGWQFLLLMLATILTAFINGKLLEKYKNKIHFIASCLMCTGPLIYFKYTDFFIKNFNSIFNTNVNLLKLLLPVGISFYTFQLMTYIIDVYRGKIESEKNIINLALYITFFPQLVAGPIVTYVDMKNQLKERKHSLELFTEGVFMFLIGFGKKILLANQLGEFCSVYHASTDKTILLTWAYAISYSLQVYFDFAGYSEMAIGLGKMFGFQLPRNFNYPFIACSIKDFWKRWHITLSTFFKDYVYIPLGGSRCKPLRRMFNLFVVWFLTGFWHGADWVFIIWGLYFFVLLCFEKYVLKDKVNVFTRIITPILAIISFVIFGSTSFANFSETFLGLFSGNLTSTLTAHHLSNYGCLILIAIIGATPLPKFLFNKLKETKLKPIIPVLQEIFIILVFLLSTAYLVDGSFNPFLYFRF